MYEVSTRLTSPMVRAWRSDICGLAYNQSFDGTPVNDNIIDQYVRQIARGTEGFGVFNGKHLVKAAKEERIIRWLEKPKNQSDLILFHHRWPTSTINCRKAAHPFTTKDYFGDTQYVMIHNGTVSNAKDLFVKHQELGIEYQSLLDDLTFNDSEALMWDLALTLEGKQDKLTAYGGIAFICMKMVNGEPERLFFARNHSKPLNLLRNKQQMFLSSEGEGEEIEPNVLHNYNYQLNRMTTKHFYIPAWDTSYDWEETRGKYNQNTCGYQPQGAPLLPAWSSREWENEFATTEENWQAYAFRQNETYTKEGVYWQDEYGEEYFDKYYTAPMYYRPMSEATIVRDVLAASRYRNVPLLKMYPTSDDVDEAVRQYIEEAMGDATTAYWNMEIDYEGIEQEPLGTERTRKLELLQKAIGKIEAGEDFELLEVS